MPSSTPLKVCRAPEGQKQVYRFSQLSTDKASFWHVLVLRSRHFFEWVWRGRDEKFRTVEKSDTVQGIQKLENTCFWDFHIPTEMAQRVWAPSHFVPILITASHLHRTAGSSRSFTALRKDAGLYCGSRLREGRSVCLCWEHSKPKGPKGSEIKATIPGSRQKKTAGVLLPRLKLSATPFFCRRCRSRQRG